MPNTNGLIASHDVCGTGAVNSNFYLRKGQPIVAPIVASPLTIVSPDGTKQGVISEDNNGSMLLASGIGDLSLSAGSGRLFIQSPNTLVSTQITQENSGSLVIVNGSGPVQITSDSGLIIAPLNAGGAGELTLQNSTQSATPARYETYVASVSGGGLTAGNLQTFGYPTGLTRSIINHAPDGSSTIIGDSAVVGGCNLSVAGRVGANSPAILSRVFDSVFNPPPAPPVGVRIIFATASSLTTGTLSEIITPVVVPGIYMLQARVNLQYPQGGTAPVFGTSINSYLQTISPSNYISFSAFNILPSMLFAPAENGDNDATFSSVAFVVPSAGDWNLIVEVNGTWNFNTGGEITYQLLRLA